MGLLGDRVIRRRTRRRRRRGGEEEEEQAEEEEEEEEEEKKKIPCPPGQGGHKALEGIHSHLKKEEENKFGF